MQKKRNIILFGALLVTLSLIIVLELTSQQESGLDVDKKQFQLDPNQEITDVYLKSNREGNHFSYLDGRWLLNDTLYLDQSMRDVFFSVVSQLEIRRPVVKTQSDSISNLLREEGINSKITFGGDVIQEYWIGGNRQEQISWIMGENGVPYQIHIPGYQSYIAGIFTVPTKDWRSRFMVNLNFAMVQKIELKYTEKDKDLELLFKDNFFTVPGMTADSTKVATFLDQLAYLQADQFLDETENGGRYDSLIENSEVFSTINFTMLSGENVKISFWEITRNDRFMLAQLDDKSLALVDKRRIGELFKTREDFD